MTVRLGLIGLGNWGRRLAAAVADTDGARLSACYSRSPERRVRFGEEFAVPPVASLDEMWDAVDGVVIATPHSTHVELVTAAAAGGVHVMCEKPLALSTADGHRAIAAADAAGVWLQVAHYRRRFAPIRRMRAMIERNELGTLLQVDGHFSKPFGPDPARPWRDRPDEAPAGAMTALGVHTVDDMLFLAGPIASVSALSARLLDDSSLDDATTALLHFESGVQGSLRTSLRTPTVASVAAFGSAGAAKSSDDGRRLFTSSLPDDVWIEHDVQPTDGVADNIAAFVASVRDGTPPETDGRAGLAVVAVMEAIVESAAGGGTPVGVTSETNRPA